MLDLNRKPWRLAPWLVCLFVCFCLPGASFAQLQEPTHIRIATGDKSGVFYHLGQKICATITENTNNISCEAVETGGTVENLHALQQGKVEFAISQAILQDYAYIGKGLFKDEDPHDLIRSILALHIEALTVIVREDSFIESLDDIKGARINVESDHSGTHALFKTLIEQKGWTEKDFASVSKLNGASVGRSLCDEHVDVLFCTIGHPNKVIRTLQQHCPIRMIEMEKNVVTEIINETPLSHYTTIPKGMYEGLKKDIPTFGMKTLLSASAVVPDDVVYEITRIFYSHLGALSLSDPLFKTMYPQALVNSSDVAPLHSGAQRYYKDAGILKK